MIAAALIAAAVTAQVGAGLDCALGFDALAAQFAAAKPTPYASADPLLETSSDNDLRLYTVTRAGHPAHPMAVKRQIKVGGATTVETSACGFGDKAAFETLIQQIYQLNVRLAQSY